MLMSETTGPLHEGTGALYGWGWCMKLKGGSDQWVQETVLFVVEGFQRHSLNHLAEV